MNTDTPVCLILFNRPDKLRRVMEAVRTARPHNLVVLADGPRADAPQDPALCHEARSIVEDGIDWPCEVIRDYADANLGCWSRTLSGLDRVFKEFDSAIILEDDCLPDPSFFSFCEELLARFRDDTRVSMISGNNFHDGSESPWSYYFSRIHNIWGWATWRDRWQAFDPEMGEWPAVRDTGALGDILHEETRVEAWKELFDYAHSEKAWDFAWMFDGWCHNRFAIVPSRNLVTNIGFGPGATHMRDPNHPQASVARDEMPFPLVHPSRFFPNSRADRLYELIIFPQLRPDPGTVEETPAEMTPMSEPTADDLLVSPPPESGKHSGESETDLKRFLRLRAFARGVLMLFLPRSWIHGSISERLRSQYRRP